MRISILFSTTALVLAGCGGGSSGGGPSFEPIEPNGVPIEATGFAGNSSSTTQDFDFQLQDIPRVVGTPEGEIAFARQDLRFTRDAAGTRVTVDGTTYNLVPEPNGNNLVNAASGDTVTVEAFLSAAGVGGFEVFSVREDNTLNRGNVVIGLDTDPARIANLSGTATATGAMIGTLTNEFDLAFADGTFELTADFTNGTVSGNATLINPGLSGSDFTFPDVDIGLNETDIVRNGFAGGITVDPADIDGRLVTGGYEGRFFGTDGQSVGGYIFGQVDVNGEDSDTFVEAIFVGE